MFTKEMDKLLKMRADWDISSYRELLVGISGTEKKEAYVQKKLTELLDALNLLKSLRKNNEYKLNVVNENNALDFLSKISDFVNDFEEVKKFKKENADIFKSNARFSNDYETIENGIKSYSDIKSKEPDFRNALSFYKRFLDLGIFSESKLKTFYDFITFKYNSKYSEFLPDESVMLINHVVKTQKDLEAAEKAARRAAQGQ